MNFKQGPGLFIGLGFLSRLVRLQVTHVWIFCDGGGGGTEPGCEAGAEVLLDGALEADVDKEALENEDKLGAMVEVWRNTRLQNFAKPTNAFAIRQLA